jgi:hypothetical protein
MAHHVPADDALRQEVEALWTEVSAIPAVFISAYGGWNWTKTEGQATKVTFATDAQGAAYIETHRHLVLSIDQEDPAWDNAPLMLGAMYPSCEHGLSLHLCAGPGHYPAGM